MTKEEFKEVALGDYIFNEKEESLRHVVGGKTTKESLTGQNVFYSDDYLQISEEDSKDWSIYLSFDSIKSQKLRERILMEEIMSLKEIVYTHLNTSPRIHLF